MGKDDKNQGTDTGRVKCKLCDQRFEIYEELQVHFSAIHPSYLKKVRRWAEDDLMLASLGLDLEEIKPVAKPRGSR